jgi:hypothetical protein
MTKKQQPIQFLPNAIEDRLDRIVIELHDLGREVESLKFAPPKMASLLRKLGDSTSNLKPMIHQMVIYSKAGKKIMVC